MSRYYNPETCQILTESQLRDLFPTTLFPKPFSPPDGWVVLLPQSPLPTFNPMTQFLIDQKPLLLPSGQYRESKGVANLSPKVRMEKRQAAIRSTESQVDADIANIQTRMLPAGVVEHDIAYTDAKGWVDLGYLGDPPASVLTYASANSIHPTEAANTIVADGDRWYSLIKMLREARLQVRSLLQSNDVTGATNMWTSVMNIVPNGLPTEGQLRSLRDLLGEPVPVDPVDQYDKDKLRLKKRGLAVADLLAGMGADNLERVRSGVWTVQDLIDLNNHPVAKSVVSLVQMQSFELAVQVLVAADHPLLTPEIKAKWIADLEQHFYL